MRRTLELCLAFGAGAAFIAIVALVAGLWHNASTTPAVLNTAATAQAIQRSIHSQRNIDVVVHCPTGIAQQAGVRFTCQATVGTRRYPVDVRQTDNDGHVDYVVK